MAEKVLTYMEMATLALLRDGQRFAYSKDGEKAWLWPNGLSFRQLAIADRDVQALRDMDFISDRPMTAGEAAQFSSLEGLTEAGRRALDEASHDR